MTEHDLQAYRQRLQRLVSRLSGNVSRLREEATGPVGEETGAPSGTPTDQADPATREADEDLALSLLGPEEQVLGEATAALDRIENGTFGRCEGCGKPIAGSRLDALPYARHCIRCARAAGPGGA
jgi:RNA polymerase-binding protein DksA